MHQQDPVARRLLLVEDSISFSYCIKAKLEKEVGLQIILAPTLAEARHAIEKYDGQFFLALLDLNLPDAQGDEVVLAATERNIPSIVFTGSCSDALRDRLFALGAIDYLNKDNPHSLNCVISLVTRLYNNAKWKALVVDDSRSQRAQVGALLRKYRFEVMEAESGKQALEILDREPNIRLVTTDFNMPEMDGCQLTKAIRRKFAPDRLAIIGISGQSSALTARFLKHGANDFLIKPFVREEFFCRITQNLDYLDHIHELAEAVGADPLTKLSNRRNFFEISEKLARQALEDQKEITVAKIDIDQFKEFNAAHGHLIGDKALETVAELIKTVCSRTGDVIARFGGDSFHLFLMDTSQTSALHLLEQIRDVVEAASFETEDGVARLTVSAGFFSAEAFSVCEMIDFADRALKAAKEAGRNQVVGADNGGLSFFNEFGYVEHFATG